MQIRISTRDCHLSPTVHAYIEEKAGKLRKYFDQIQEIRVVASIENKQATLEMIVDVEHGHDLVSKVSTPDFMQSADEVHDKLMHQLTKLKSKVSDHHHEPLKRSGL